MLHVNFKGRGKIDRFIHLKDIGGAKSYEVKSIILLEALAKSIAVARNCRAPSIGNSLLEYTADHQARLR